ncbi:glycosyltransferase family 2 protein [Agaribacter marinus]|uniref:Glycosyl transferase family 2 n=1 Tax=Agaribacter marinus TaxID=1431249 RepID=A0AA37WJ09_9ALTE|nr:glycosyltransferase family 2 protein [Agaribacter marinus]GLR69140.1 hypothetical protein GCM10007852_00480 [Agaribacter marinus]
MLSLFKKNKPIKIKLVAIAKDEAAYLPEWIYHHLKSDFDSVDIYVNHTSDNTWELAECLKDESRVQFIDGNEFFYEGNKNPQRTVYEHAYKSIDKNIFDYLMFLDIDEFWANKHKFVSVKERLKQLGHPKVLCLNWFNKHNETEFCDIYDTQQVGATSEWVKTLFSTHIKVKHVEIHNIKTNKNHHVLGDGKSWELADFKGPVGYLPEDLRTAIARDSFILHRMNRSQMEYISLLSRGAARQNQKGLNRLKTNRSGYCFANNEQEVISYPEADCKQYRQGLLQFIQDNKLEVPLKTARTFIKKRFIATLDNIKNSPIEDIKLIERITKNVTICEVVAARKEFLQPVIKEKKHEIADTLRQLAISMEKIDTKIAEDLMAKALEYKPSGPMIKRKLEEYRRKLNSELD